MKFLLVFYCLIFQTAAFSQHFGLEDLISLNQKNTTQLTGYLQRHDWKTHNTSQQYIQDKSQNFYSKKITDDPRSLEFIRHVHLSHLNDSYIELITIDSQRWSRLIHEAENKFNSTGMPYKSGQQSINVYIHKDYAFIFFKKYSEKANTTRFHVSVYNIKTYNILLREQEYKDFWLD